MNLRPKTKRRLLVLIGGAALIAGSVTAFVNVQLNRRMAARMQFRIAAMEAYTSGNYPAALDGFKNYFNNNDNADADAIYAYAVSRSKVIRPGLAHLLEAKENFRRYLTLRPGDTSAQHALLEIYRNLSYDVETLSLSDTLLKKDPNDLSALTGKMHVLERQSSYEEALAAARKVNDLAPFDLEDQKETYWLMRQLQRPTEQIIARADEMVSAHPEDPRFELLRGIAASLTGDADGAKKWVLTAATRTPPDAAFVQELSGLFDRIGMYDQARALLEKAMAQDKANTDIIAALVRRQWETGQLRDALNNLAAANPADPKADSRLLAFKAMTLYELDEVSPAATQPSSTQPADTREQAGAIVAALLKRATTDAVAAAWASPLKARFANPPLDPRAAVKAFRSAMPRESDSPNPDSAIIEYWLGLSYRDLGENDLALAEWQRAIAIEPVWTAPHVMKARVLLALGRTDEAATEAAIAARRSPDLIAVRTTLAVVAYNQLDPKAGGDQMAQLLAFVQDILQKAPNEPQTLPVCIALLTRTDHRDDAGAAIRAAMRASPPLPSDTLLKLAQIDALAHLGQGSAIAVVAGAAKPASPEAAFDDAMTLATTGHPVDGLKFIVDARQTAAKAVDASPEDSPQWDLTVARYREAIDDPGVADDWATLADSNPKNLAVQQAVVSARTAWSNRALIDRSIDRLKALTGDEGIEWRLARARFELSTTDNLHDNAAAAATMMADLLRTTPNLIEPLTVWAQALEKMGDTAGAIDRLRTAVTVSHGDPNVSMNLAALLENRGNIVEARAILKQTALYPSLTPTDRVRCARMLSLQGQYDDAISTLRAGDTPDGMDPDRDLLLAQLLQAQGKPEDAAKLFDNVLNSQQATDTVVRLAARFYAGRQDMTKALAALDRLKTLNLAPGARELTIASFNEQFRDQPSALAQYQAATLAAPSSVAAWKGLAGYQLRHHDFTAAAAAADQGLKIITDNPQLASLASSARTLSSLKTNDELQPLIIALAADPTDPAGEQTLAALSQNPTTRESDDPSPLRLREVADEFPRFLPAQLLLAERYFNLGRLNDADEVATRAMQASPTEPEPARVLSAIAATAGHWDRALTAAVEWRNRTLDRPLSADTAIAEARLHLNDASGAMHQIAAYLDQAKASPDSLPDILRLQAMAQAEQGHTDEAQATLEPMLKQAAGWRGMWLEIGAATAKDITTSAGWIDKVTPVCDPSSPVETRRLALAWFTTGQRFSDVASLQKSRDLLKPLADSAAPPAGVSVLYGMVTQQLGDLATAEAAYRRALGDSSTDPAMAQNNLAYTILLRDGDMKEAKTLAEAAVAQSPGSSTYLDTLARIQLRLGDTGPALTAFQNAVRFDAGNIEALVGLADAQCRAGQRDKAILTIERVDQLMRSNPALAESVRRQLDEVKSTLKRSGETSSADVK